MRKLGARGHWALLEHSPVISILHQHTRSVISKDHCNWLTAVVASCLITNLFLVVSVVYISIVLHFLC